MRMRDFSISQKTVWLIALISVVLFFANGRWNRNKVIEGDVIAYYSYLPAVFIQGDISMKFAVGNDFYADKIWGVIWQDGFGPVQKYTMGLSWLFLPFFLLAHLSAKLLGFAANGYSVPYQFWLQLSAIFYLILGLHWLRSTFLRYYSEKITAICLVLLAYGTNLYYYSQGQGTMPHVYLFALVSGIMWLSIRFYETPDWTKAIGLGAICGVATLIRPNDMVLWIIPAFYGLTNRHEFRGRLIFWKSNWPKLFVWPLLQVLILIPQLLYWKYMTLHWLYYSYADESFFWANPAILQVLFSFRNGWLIYSPLMALGLVGIFLLRKHARPFSLVIPGIVLLSIYVISCWWCWWYGGSFGQRGIIEYYPLLALGIGAILTRFVSLKPQKAIRVAGLSLLSFLLLLNLFQTFQFGRGIIHYDSMTAEAYFHSFGRVQVGKDYKQYLETPDYDGAKIGER